MYSLWLLICAFLGVINALLVSVWTSRHQCRLPPLIKCCIFRGKVNLKFIHNLMFLSFKLCWESVVTQRSVLRTFSTSAFNAFPSSRFSFCVFYSYFYFCCLCKSSFALISFVLPMPQEYKFFPFHTYINNSISLKIFAIFWQYKSIQESLYKPNFFKRRRLNVI